MICASASLPNLQRHPQTEASRVSAYRTMSPALLSAWPGCWIGRDHDRPRLGVVKTSSARRDHHRHIGPLAVVSLSPFRFPSLPLRRSRLARSRSRCFTTSASEVCRGGRKPTPIADAARLPVSWPFKFCLFPGLISLRSALTRTSPTSLRSKVEGEAGCNILPPPKNPKNRRECLVASRISDPPTSL